MILVAETTEPVRVDAGELLRRLEEGVKSVMSSDGWRLFLSTQAKFHNYSAGNVLLILMQNPQATRVAGFHTWRDLGRAVKKGEHGIAILAPVFPKREKQEPGDQKERPEGGQVKTQEAAEPERTPVRFRVAYVFDIAQTDGKQLPEAPVHRLTGDSQAARLLFARLSQLAIEQNLHLQYEGRETMPRGANGYYQPATCRIVLAKDLAPEQQAKIISGKPQILSGRAPPFVSAYGNSCKETQHKEA